MGRPREHGPQTRERLLAEAARLLDAEGVGALTVRRLADGAGVSSRAVYSLFGGMPGLVTALYRRGFESMARQYAKVPVRKDAVAEILDLAIAYRRTALEQRELYGLMFERAIPWFEPSAEDVASAFNGLQRLRDAVERAVKQRGLRRRDPERMTTELWAVAHGLASLELRGCLGPPEGAARAWRETTRIFTAGMFPSS